MEMRPVPQAVEAEQALLGGLMQAPEQFEEVARTVRADDFYRPDHAALFTLLKDMRNAPEHIDLITVSERVQRGGEDENYGGLAYVVDLPDKVPSTANLAHYARVVREKASLRRLIRTAQQVMQEAHGVDGDASMLIDHATQAFTDLAEMDAARDWKRISEIADEELMRIQRLSESPHQAPGITTGFTGLDKQLTGFHPSQLIILAARPAMGKTALALNLAFNAAVQGEKAVGLFSLEMSRGELVTRMLCSEAFVEGEKVRTGHLDGDDWFRLDEASEVLRRAPIYIDDSPGMSADDIRARARRLKAVHNDLGLIVIDYLQLMEGRDPKSSRQQQISEISRGLKILAKELEVPVLALSQLNRDVEKRQDKRPMVSDLRESGAIEQDADVIMFIYRDEVYHPDSAEKGVAEVIVAKQRAGATGTIKLAFQRQFTRFANLHEGEHYL